MYTGGRFLPFRLGIFLLILNAFLVLTMCDNREDLLSSEERAWLSSHGGVISLTPDPAFPPVGFFDENGTYSGLSADYVSLIEKRLSIKFEINHVADWSAVLEEGFNRRTDVIIPTQKTDERAEYLLFTEPYVVVPTVIITSRKNRDLATMQQLAGRKVAVIEGHAIIEFIKEKYSEIEIVSVNNENSGLAKTTAGEVDAMIAELPVAAYIVEKMGYTNLSISGRTGHEYNLAFASRNDSPVLHSILVKGLNSLTYDEKRDIYNKWISLGYSPFYMKVEFWIVSGGAAAFVFLVISLILVWNYSLRKIVRKKTEELREHKEHLEEVVNLRTEELARAKEAAEIANRVKSEFLANMSHEIRTPMNAIIGFTDVMRKRIKDPQLLDYIEAVNSSGRALLNIINGILDLAKVEAGKLQLEYSDVHIRKILNEMKTLFYHKAAGRGIDILFDISDEVPEFLFMDETRIRQILLNLLGNAVKFTESGYVKCSVYPGSQLINGMEKIDLKITVEDTGAGIPEESAERIFEPFEQYFSEGKFSYGGTGLGLTITKHLVTLMNGEISVRSNLGAGSVFIVTLPDVKIVNGQSAVSEEMENDIERIRFRKSTILIADDMRINRELIKEYLEGYDFFFLEAQNGSEVLEIVKEFHPDLLLLDMKMPVMDGYATASVLKGDPQLKEIPLIAITASALKRDRDAVRNLCDSFISKPVRANVLIREIMKFIPFEVPSREINKYQSSEVNEMICAAENYTSPRIASAEEPGVFRGGGVTISDSGLDNKTACAADDYLHDFNNAAAGITSVLSLMSVKLEKNGFVEKDKLEKYITTINESVERSREIIISITEECIRQ